MNVYYLLIFCFENYNQTFVYLCLYLVYTMKEQQLAIKEQIVKTVVKSGNGRLRKRSEMMVLDEKDFVFCECIRS